MDFVISSTLFKLLVISGIVILFLSTGLILSLKDLNTPKRISLILLTWFIPIIGGLTSLIILFLNRKLNLR
jgi:hypothetical protein